MPRSKKPQRVRVKLGSLFHYAPRATLLEKRSTARTPESWPYSARLARVRFDHGLDAFVPDRRPRRIKAPDDYEALFAAPEERFAQLLALPPLESARQLAHIGVDNTPWHTHPVLNDPEGGTILILDTALRYAALLRRLPAGRGLDVGLDLLERWCAPGLSLLKDHPWGEGMTHYRLDDFRYGLTEGFQLYQVRDVLLGALAFLLCERHGEGLDAVRRERLGALVALDAAQRDYDEDHGADPRKPPALLLRIAGGEAPPALRDHPQLTWDPPRGR